MSCESLLRQIFPGIPPGLPVLFFVEALLGVLLLGVVSILLLSASRLAKRPLPLPVRRLSQAGALLVGVGALCLAWGLLVEPLWLDTSHTTFRTDRLPKGEHFRIALVSDLHIAGWTPLLRTLPDTVNAQRPDLIIYTGDSLNSIKALPIFRAVLSRMHAPWGTYAVRGNHDYEWGRDVPLFSGGLATELDGTPIVIDHGLVTLCGSRWKEPDELMACLDQAGPGLHIAAYHSPDMFERAVEDGADLYLAGHTHGGQVRLPFYGALVTMSAFGKKYEAGRYDADEAMLYVNRGIGEESKAPQVRFLCRPELTIVEVVGTGDRIAPVRVVRRGDKAALPPVLE